MGYKETICDMARAREIRWLAHFTPLSNLAGIVEHGLLPRSQLDTQGLEYTFTDGWRLDSMLESSSVSITDPNWAMLRQKQTRVQSADWAIFYFDPSVLWTHDCRFCYRNAAHNDLVSCTKFRGGPWGFSTMFEDFTPSLESHGNSYREYRRIGPHQPTLQDAEVQVRGRVAPELILGIDVDHSRHVDYANALLGALNELHGGNRIVGLLDF